jgi:hypothetical protein
MPHPDDRPGARRSMPGPAAIAVDPRTNGHDAGNGALPATPRRGRPPGPSTKPALIVLGLTLALFLVGVALELASGSQSRPTRSPTSITTARGAGLHAAPARRLLSPIVTLGQPPDDLLDALAVPAGAAPVPSSALNRGIETYDRSLRFEVDASQQQVITFFRAQLPAEHWTRLSQGAASGVPGYQILAQHPASDGREWELGVVVSPTVFGSTATTPGSSTPGSTSPATGTTAFTFRLFVQSDQD